MNLEIDNGFNADLEIERLERVPEGDITFLGSLAHGLLHELTDVEKLHNFLTERSDALKEVVEKTGEINAGVALWWGGLVENIEAAYREFIDEAQVIESQPFKVTRRGLLSQNFGLLRRLAIDNVKKFRPQDFDPLEAATLEWAERMILEEPGTQVLYGMSCKKNNKIRFLASLSRPTQNSGLVYGKSYRIGELPAEEAEDLLASLTQGGENRQIETQEVVDEKGQKRTISLLIIRGDKNFVNSLEEIESVTREKGREEPQIRLETVLESEKGDDRRNIVEEPPLLSEDIKLDSPQTATVTLKEQGKKVFLFNFSSLRVRDESKPDKSKRELVMKPSVGSSESILRKDNNVLSSEESEESSSFPLNTSHQDSAERYLSPPISASLLRRSRLDSRSERRRSEETPLHLRPKNKEKHGRDKVIFAIQLKEEERDKEAVAIIQVGRESLEIKPEKQNWHQKKPHQEAPWATAVVQNESVVSILENETGRPNILEENCSLPAQSPPGEIIKETLHQLEGLLMEGEELVVSEIEAKQEVQLVQSHLQERQEQEVVSKLCDVVGESESVVPKTQGLAAEQGFLVGSIGKSLVDGSFVYQPLLSRLVESDHRFGEETIGVKEQEEIQQEPLWAVVESLPEAMLEPRGVRLTEPRMTNIELPEAFVIEPEKVEPARAREVIERLEIIKRLKKERPAEFSLPKTKLEKTGNRKLRSPLFNWQILILQLRLKERIFADLSLSGVIKELILVPLTKTRAVNRFEQKENRASIYVSSQKAWPKSFSQSQVIFDRRWLPKVVYEAEDSLPLIAFKEKDNYFGIPMTDIIVPFEKRAVIRADEYQEVFTLDEILVLDELRCQVYQNLRFLPLPLSNLL